jgi:ubiquinone/menaquinone biosynthesis C-methylase UbiE
MLNTSFSQKTNLATGLSLSADIVEKIKTSNSNFSTGKEKRLTAIFTEETWKKIKNLGLTEKYFANKNILDLCAGTGFLSYHLAKKINAQTITLIDISQTEITEAKKTLSEKFPGQNFSYRVGDITKMDFPDNSFDIVIGNSFIHHLWDINKALQEIKRVIKPGGVFIALHEPAPICLAYESGSLITAWLFLKNGDKIINSWRPEIDTPGTDVWLFDKPELEKIFAQNGFKNIRIKNWHIFRSLITFWLKFHELKDGKDFSLFQKTSFRAAIFADKILQLILPSRLFGSSAIIAYK